MVDFNHPLAGKGIVYDAEIVRLVEDDAEKVKGFASMYLGLPDVKVEVANGVAKVDVELPAQFVKAVEKKIVERIPSLKSVEFKNAKVDSPKAEVPKKAK